jgi:hypothetical protein
MAGEARRSSFWLVGATIALVACGSRSGLLDPTLVPALTDAGETVIADAGPIRQDAGSNAPRPVDCADSRLIKLADLKWARYLALDEEYVYWADPADKSFGRVHKCGGTSERLGAVPRGDPLDVVIEGEFLYATVQGESYGEGQVVRLPKRGGSVQVLADSIPTPEPLVSDGTALFFEHRGMVRMALNGGLLTMVAPTVGSTYGSFPVDDTHVYWVDRTVMRAPKLGGPTEHIADCPDDALAWCAEADETHVYWTTYGGRAFRVSKTGGAPEAIADQEQWRCMTLDATHAYLAKDEGPVVAVNKRTLRRTTLQRVGATDVKVDSRFVYTAVGLSPGAIYREGRSPE